MQKRLEKEVSVLICFIKCFVFFWLKLVDLEFFLVPLEFFLRYHKIDAFGNSLSLQLYDQLGVLIV